MSIAKHSPGQRLILASQSPRRKELLDKMGLAGQYEVTPSEFEERLDDGRSTQEVAEELGYGKALWVAERNPGAWVVGGDTIVTIDGKQLGKVADEAEARHMLKLLAGRAHTITTSVALVRMDTNAEGERIIKHYIGHETSQVFFKPYEQATTEAYIASGGWRGMAGAYGIQNREHTLIEAFAGAYDTVLGLPTRMLADFLSKAGIDAHVAELVAPVPRKTALA